MVTSGEVTDRGWLVAEVLTADYSAAYRGVVVTPAYLGSFALDYVTAADRTDNPVTGRTVSVAGTTITARYYGAFYGTGLDTVYAPTAGSIYSVDRVAGVGFKTYRVVPDFPDVRNYVAASYATTAAYDSAWGQYVAAINSWLAGVDSAPVRQAEFFDARGLLGTLTLSTPVTGNILAGSVVQGLSWNVTGSSFADTLGGTAQADTINGAAGDDRLMGGAGGDTLIGGSGSDTFAGTIAEMAGDSIADLTGEDRILVTDASLATFSYVLSGGTLSFGGQSLTLAGVKGKLAVEAAAGGGVSLRLVGADSVGDFNGDGRSDLLWRNTNGALSTWQIAGNGTQVQQSAYNATVDTAWRVIETGDFNGDGRWDILWRHTNGTFSIWTGSGDGGFKQGAYTEASVGNEWRIAAVRDFNGDGKDDLLWQHSNGTISAWSSIGLGFQQNSYSHVSPGAGWRVVGAADFNGDGRSDLAWRNDNGGVATWLASGSGFSDGGYFAGGIPTSWHIDGIGDFDGDGRADLLWRNDNGAVSLWRSNGDGFNQGVYNAAVANSWAIATVGDFNADGRADIAWRNTNGAVSTWHSNGGGFAQSIYNSAAPTGWTITGHDFPL